MIEGQQPSRLGFLAGKATVPADFNQMFDDDIARMFAGKDA
jgi:hypothetical protein